MPTNPDDKHGLLMSDRLSQSHADALSDYEKSAGKNHAFFRVNYNAIMPSDHNVPILEIGSGLGQFLHYLQKEGYTKITGIDLSPDHAAFCKQRGFDVLLSGAIPFLKSSSESYGAIVLNDVIEHQTKPQIWELLALIHARLRPGGVVIMKTINMANPIMGVHSRYNDFTHEVGWTEESMLQVLHGAGFSPAKVLPSNLYVFYSNPLNYVGLAIAKLFDLFFLFYYRLHGRPTTRIFTKNLIGVGYKPVP